MGIHNKKLTGQIIDWLEQKDLEVLDTSYKNDLCDSIEVNGYRVNLPNSFVDDPNRELFRAYQVCINEDLVEEVSTIEEVYELIRKL